MVVLGHFMSKTADKCSVFVSSAEKAREILMEQGGHSSILIVEGIPVLPS